MRTRRTTTIAGHKIIYEIAEQDMWDYSVGGKSKTSKKGIIRKRKRSMKDLGAVIAADNDNSSTGAVEAFKDVKALLDAVDKFLASTDVVVEKDNNDEVCYCYNPSIIYARDKVPNHKVEQ